MGLLHHTDRGTSVDHVGLGTAIGEDDREEAESAGGSGFQLKVDVNIVGLR